MDINNFIGSHGDHSIKKEPFYKVKTNSLRVTCQDPQIWEADCENGVTLYIRYSKGSLTCLQKATGTFICSGNPALDKDKIPNEKVPFYIEMYSQYNVEFQ